MIRTLNSTKIRKGVMALLMASVLWVYTAPAQAAEVTQLDITGGSISLNFGVLGTVSGTFNADGQILMDQFQPPPNIFDPITISHLTFSIFSSSGGALNLPAPTAQTTDSTMTADLRSLFAGVTSSGWSWMNTNSAMSSLNIGGTATGSFNQTSNAFDIAWTNPFNLTLTTLPVLGPIVLTSGNFSLQGTAQVAPVPVPAAVWLFGSGLASLIPMIRRRLMN
ncbi:MAG: hypothetical protein A4E20_11730 [Nitrospira sp. SG-bin2]|jgi:hypothetical protein|uniref:hypothetical protein n=1 Tax=Nitrospira cf. moscoviensis SBR1015 TaxID=96242 RepID=UPI000A0CEAC4|nr:hypothetical protein [Nitrospira cf. moscoviensis SBR1015]OQW34211.1 MAG: hypothetical protein A4E20_11730 [Nitrospira sp. SG-bin2]